MVEGGSEQCQVYNVSKEVAFKGDSDDRVGKEKLDYLGQTLKLLVQKSW